mmetsp:Transcript_1364/g.2861  ORF Transcript_1364/g.2861 Transcript_1364/m.2861 type:complete len:193 (+) Transcript_1364:74-652(+)
MRAARMAALFAVGMLPHMVSGVALRGDGPAAATQQPATTEQRLEALQPVLEKLRGLDPKAFGALSGMLSHASSASLLQRGDDVHQVSRPSGADASDPEAARKLEALQPVLEKLRGLDSKTFGVLSNMMAQATGESFIQRGASDAPAQDAAAADPEMSEKIEKLQPVLEKLRGLDSKAFGALSNMMAQAAAQH